MAIFFVDLIKAKFASLETRYLNIKARLGGNPSEYIGDFSGMQLAQVASHRSKAPFIDTMFEWVEDKVDDFLTRSKKTPQKKLVTLEDC